MTFPPSQSKQQDKEVSLAQQNYIVEELVIESHLCQLGGINAPPSILRKLLPLFPHLAANFETTLQWETEEEGFTCFNTFYSF